MAFPVGDVVTRENLDLLPYTARSRMPYEILWDTVQEVWSNGEGSSSFVARCRSVENDIWLREMAGEVGVVYTGGKLYLQRYAPEPLQYGDRRKMWCSDFELADTGGKRLGGPFCDAINKWPQPDWMRYRTVFRTFPYSIRTEAEVTDLMARTTGTSSVNSARELLRYVIRQRRVSAKAQPLPVGDPSNSFRAITAGTPVIPGASLFKTVTYADVAYTWVRVPVGWPPPAAYPIPGTTPLWPPSINPKVRDPLTTVYARDSLVGKVNDAVFDSVDPKGFAFDAGQLMYIGFDDSHRYYDVVGDEVMTWSTIFKIICSIGLETSTSRRPAPWLRSVPTAPPTASAPTPRGILTTYSSTVRVHTNDASLTRRFWFRTGAGGPERVHRDHGLHPAAPVHPHHGAGVWYQPVLVEAGQHREHPGLWHQP